jgi:hypothetical protein
MIGKREITLCSITPVNREAGVRLTSCIIAKVHFQGWTALSMLRSEDRPLSSRLAMTRNQEPDGVVAAIKTS